MLSRGIIWLFSVDFDEGNSIENIVRALVAILLLGILGSFFMSIGLSYTGALPMFSYIMGIISFTCDGILAFVTLCMMISRS